MRLLNNESSISPFPLSNHVFIHLSPLEMVKRILIHDDVDRGGYAKWQRKLISMKTNKNTLRCLTTTIFFNKVVTAVSAMYEQIISNFCSSASKKILKL